MADTYTKLFSSIISSSIWSEDDKTRILWITMLAMSDENGEVRAAVPGLADLSRMTIQDCKKSLGKLMSPDEYSRTPDYDGRRIREVPGGYLIINRNRYRDMGQDRTEYWRKYKQRKRAENEDLSTMSTVEKVDKCGKSTNSTQAEAKAEVKVKNNNNTHTGEKTKKKKYLDCLMLIDGEVEKLCKKLGTDVAKDYLERLNDYVGSTGKRYKSHYHTILNWYRHDKGKGKPTASAKKKTRLFPIQGKNCSKHGCNLPAVYKAAGGNYDSFYCGEHMPDSVKEKYTA